MEKWQLSYDEMADLIGRYKLASYIEENEEEINEYGVDGALEYMLEQYIIRNGGKLPR